MPFEYAIAHTQDTCVPRAEALPVARLWPGPLRTGNPVDPSVTSSVVAVLGRFKRKTDAHTEMRACVCDRVHAACVRARVRAVDGARVRVCIRAGELAGPKKRNH